MSDLKFYRDERVRWPVLNSIDISEAWAERALKKLVRHFKLDRLPYGNGPVKLEFKGRSTSWGGRGGITLAKSRDWLIFLHEVAHVWEYRKHGSTYHRRRMVRYVDRLCRYATKMGWAEQDLDEQFRAWAAEQVDTDAAEAVGDAHEALLAAEPVLIQSDWHPDATAEAAAEMLQPGWRTAAQSKPDQKSQRDAERLAKIARREAQVKRLERRIKSLTTRLGKAKRSLNALRRATVGPADGRPLV